MRRSPRLFSNPFPRFFSESPSAPPAVGKKPRGQRAKGAVPGSVLKNKKLAPTGGFLVGSVTLEGEVFLEWTAGALWYW
ncbi:MAG: hypothetical protein AVDCRST_MAG28-1501 [uncultured Rubrobacteraceae bacterium]|uniref:Uncharacterized protein n=1 Tax=uncultured Rubrobacteraceae bacterium TaxID=349277 RepID=A0A6J4Q378_9ACTN|nr:MAG: hypothetical protein AVDCRST_MAG28-1501 [uncultured Rubrobacteraceae bacterium]